MEYSVDVKRYDKYENSSTGIYVRAKMPDGTFGNADILWLSKESLDAWLVSRGGKNGWAENCVALLLGHELR